MSEGPQTLESSPVIKTQKRRNHALWLGPLIVFVGAVSYFTFFAQFPALRDFPWINLPIVIAGFALSFTAVKRAFSQPDIYRGKISGSLAFVFSTLLSGLFVGYISYLSYQLPEPTPITQNLAVAPEFTLTDQNDQPISLSDFHGKKLIITFYRGHW